MKTQTSDFLESFPAGVRSFIANIFCYGVRAGQKDVDGLMDWVRSDIIRRLGRQYTTAEQVPHLIKLRESLPSSGARDFASFIIHRESLSKEERELIKNEKSRIYQEQSMASQEPTEKQLAYLRSLRCATIPKTKLEASRLIEKYKR